MQFGKRPSLKNLWYSRLVIIGLALFCMLLLPSVYSRFVVERDMAARTTAAQAEYDRMLQHKADLQKRVEYLKGERGVEEEIRRNFDVARMGEEVVILTGEAPATSTPSLNKPEIVYPWWQFWR